MKHKKFVVYKAYRFNIFQMHTPICAYKIMHQKFGSVTWVDNLKVELPPWKI